MSQEKKVYSGGKDYYVIDRGSRTTVERPSWVPFHRDTIATVRNDREAFDAIKSDSGSDRIRVK